MNGKMQAGVSGTAADKIFLVRTVSGFRQSSSSVRALLMLLCLMLMVVCLVAETVQDQPSGSSSSSASKQTAGEQASESSGAINLEELNSIVQQYNEATGPTNRQLASDIISRLMLDNLTGSSWRPSGELDVLETGLSDDDSYELGQPQVSSAPVNSGMSRLDVDRLKKLMAMVQSYEMNAAVDDGHGVFQYASLPTSEASTMKRAKMLLMRQQQGGRIPYSRGSFDFGLGKRGQNFLRRFGELENGQVSSGIQYGKRPAASAHRYDFGLGKRVVSPSYPRFDFGLGKRASANRNRFDFGLGRK